MTAGVMFALGLAVGACTPLYVAPALNGPLLSESGELHAAGSMAITSLAFDLDLAFAPSDWVALMGAVSYGPRDPDRNEHAHTYGELGAGTFVPFGIGRFEVFLGAGYGDATGEIKVYPGGVDSYELGTADYARFFCQADLGLALDYLELGLVLRAAHVTAWHTAEDQTRRTLQDLFVEVGAFVRGGWERVKFELQGQIIVPTSHYPTIAADAFQITLGVHLAFDLY